MEYDRSVSPEQLRYYLDGANFFTINANQVDATTWNNATHHGFFLILNVAMGGGFPAAFGGGPTAATVSGQPMLVDYVAVYTKGSSSGGTGGGRTGATSTIQAESFAAQAGTTTEACADTGGGQDVGTSATATGCSTTASTSVRPGCARSTRESPAAPPRASAGSSRCTSTP